ncbi:MAG: lysozyme inhibitor LprI family protein [Rubrivivax sp.]
MRYQTKNALHKAAAVALLLPALALAQPSGAERTGPPLPERLRTLDEGVQQEQAELLRLVSADARDGGRLATALKAQQTAWLQHRDAACALIGTVDGAAGPTRAMQCKAEWAEAQRMRLWSALDCISQVPPAERAAEQERCLQALASSLRP